MPGSIFAQATVNYCEAPPRVKDELKRVAKLNDEDLPFKVRREQQIAMFRDLVDKCPGDFFVQRRYQDARLSGFYVDKQALLADYRSQMEKNPSDPGGSGVPRVCYCSRTLGRFVFAAAA